ncbi:MAG TPA: methylated-DNA--[protein]-cysteine S-methyltransferase, partial [Burkholderiaceae bacterium]|nr:methylated-DNA--[protein]-cysteine S-methyltransferase [Burkholderiaceae bacterium]
ARRLNAQARAVGQACGDNHLPLAIPCHRVVAASGIGGFAHHRGGAYEAIKRWLLLHEAGGELRLT